MVARLQKRLKPEKNIPNNKRHPEISLTGSGNIRGLSESANSKSPEAKRQLGYKYSKSVVSRSMNTNFSVSILPQERHGISKCYRMERGVIHD